MRARGTSGLAAVAAPGLVLSLGLVLALLLPSAARAALDTAPEAACGIEAARQERLLGIPTNLLKAIAMVESGRYDADRRASFAWPWTVMAEGRGRFLPTKAAAIAEVQALRSRGVRNIDVGCMQVNLQYHPTAFASLEQAFEPSVNVGYAARFLVGLYESTNNWPTAGAYYHSQTPDLAAAYQRKLMAAWSSEGQTGTAAVAALLPGRVPTLGTHLYELAAADRAVLAARRQTQLAAAQASRQEAGRIAGAWRAARLAEYRLRKVTLVADRR